jgi:hypothetical protein
LASKATVSPQQHANVGRAWNLSGFLSTNRHIAVLRIAMIYTWQIRGADAQVQV